jgi:hypothetical protein
MRRIDREKKTIDHMLRVYCRNHHGSSDGLCAACVALQEYAHSRLDTCPFQQEKPACNKCTVHCYSRQKRVEVKDVMRYSGPRMMLRHPVLALLHLLDLVGEPPTLKKRK